jgi:hypothetical protein
MTKLIVSDVLEQQCAAQFGFRTAHAVEAAEQPDQTDVLQQDDLVLRIHSKHVPQAEPPFHLVVIERLGGQKRVLEFGAKVYSDLAEGMYQLSPSHMLEALAEHFGAVLRIGTQRSKFIWAAKIPVAGERDVEIVQTTGPRSGRMIQSMYLKFEKGEPMKANCALCFCLNATEISRWLQQHKR